MIQYMCFIGGIKHPAGDDGCERVDEVAATDGVTALDRSVVYFKSVFVLFENKFKKPSLGVGLVCSFQRKIQIRLEYDGAEAFPFLIVFFFRPMFPFLMLCSGSINPPSRIFESP